MQNALPDVRRIVTGHTGDGVTTIVEDGPTPAMIKNPDRPGYVVRNIWHTGAAPAPIDAPDDIVEHEGVLPPRGGTILRIIDIPPEPDDPVEARRQIEAMFRATFSDADHTGADHDQRHPGMHRTRTVDYAILLYGQLTAIMDDTETVMKSGDILVQRGTNHAWSNRSGSVCRIAFILIDGS